MKDKLKTINKIFEGSNIRTIWNKENEEYYFSVVDVVGSLTDSKDPSDYWTTLKRRLIKDEKSELPTNCRKLKMIATDGKLRVADTLDTEGVFRLIQSIPSPLSKMHKSVS